MQREFGRGRLTRRRGEERIPSINAHLSMFERSNESAVIRNWDTSFESMNGYVLNGYNLEIEIAR